MAALSSEYFFSLPYCVKFLMAYSVKFVFALHNRSFRFKLMYLYTLSYFGCRYYKYDIFRHIVPEIIIHNYNKSTRQEKTYI
jgi:hypothetical protein